MREFNVLAYGAAGDSVADDTVAFQSALDAAAHAGGGRVLVPAIPSASSYRIKQIAFKGSGIHLASTNGRATLKYNGTGAAAEAMILVDKDVWHGGENFEDLLIDGFIIDGDNKALYNLDLYGFRRRCVVRHCDLTQAVCSMRGRDVHYSSYEFVEFEETTPSCPSGMVQATFDANKYGVYLSSANAVTFKKCIVYRIGGNSSNSYTAAMYIGGGDGGANGTDLSGCTFEGMDITANGKYLNQMLVVDPGSLVRAQTMYIEEVTCSSRLIEVQDNAELQMENVFLNVVKATAFIRASSTSHISLDQISGEAQDFTDRVFLLSSGTAFHNMHVGSISLGCGPLTGGTHFDASTTDTDYGLISDPIIAVGEAASGPTGYIKDGYSVGGGATYVSVLAGSAVLNGRVVGFSRHGGLTQRLYPDLSVADTWNIKISAAGTPYIERQGIAARAGSSYAPTIGTFTTAGGGAAPASVTAVTFGQSRIQGTRVDLPKSSAVQINRILTGSRTLTDTGTAAAGDLLTLTLSSAGGEDDYLSATLFYTLHTVSGATRSVETGMASFAFSKDDGGNYVVSTPTKFGSSQALDSGMASLTVSFSATNASNVATLKATAETSADVSSTIHFTAILTGGSRSTTTAALASGVTEGS